MADYKRRIIAEFSAKNKAKGEMAGFRRDMDTTGRTMKRMALGALSLAGIGGFGFLAKSMIKAASSAEETQAKFDTVFRDLSGQANIWAELFGKSVGRAERDVKSWMAGLQDTFVPLGIARGEALKLAQSLTTLAVDVASFNDAADADVIRDFTSALVGNHETVRKFGIIISETALKQEAMRQGIDKTYKNLTDLEKVQLRYNLILSGTSDAQGDAMRTADSYANQVKRLYANVDNLKVSMGEELLPALTDLVKLVNENEEAMVAFSKAILAPVKSLLYLIDIVETLHEVQKARGQGYSPGWGPSGFEFIPPSLPEGKLEISPWAMQQIAKMRAVIRERERLSKEAAAGKDLPEVIRFEEPEWLKATLDLNLMTEAQKKAANSMYEMSMKARGLSEELAREKKITQFAALATERYGADVEGAQAAVERFTKALEESEAAKTKDAAAIDRVKIQAMLDALDFEYDMLGKISEERERAITLAQFKVALEKAFGDEQLRNIDQQIQYNELMDEYEEKLNKIAEGQRGPGAFGAKMKRWAVDATNAWGNLADVTTSALDGMADTLTTAIMRGEDAWKSFAQSVLSDLTRMIIKMQMAQLLGFGGGGVPMWFSAGVGGALGGLGGGPPAGTRIQNLPGTISATYLQGGGEVVKTGWAKVHRGETYSGIGRGEVGGVTVNVNNDGMEKFDVSQAAEYWAGDQRVVDIFITRARTDGGLRRAIKEAAK